MEESENWRQLRNHSIVRQDSPGRHQSQSPDEATVFSINSPQSQSSLRFGEGQRRMLLEGKLELDCIQSRKCEDDYLDIDELAIQKGVFEGEENSKMGYNLDDPTKSKFQGIQCENIVNLMEHSDYIKVISSKGTSQDKQSPMSVLHKKKRSSVFFMLPSNSLLPKVTMNKEDNSSLVNNINSPRTPGAGDYNFSELDSINKQEAYEDNEDARERSLGSSNQREMAYSMARSRSTDQGFKGVWKKKSLIVLWLVRKFITDLMRGSEQWRFQQLIPLQLQAINDLSCDSSNFFRKRDFNNGKNIQHSKLHELIHTELVSLCLSVTKFLNKALLVYPDSIFKLLWDCGILLILFINIFFIPIKQCFTGIHSPEISPLLQIFIYDLPGWSFLVDVMVRANTAFYKKGQLITQKSKIIMQYYKESLFIDLIVSISFVISLRAEIPYMNAILLLRTNRLLRLSSSIEQTFNFSMKKSAIFSLMKLAVTMIFVAHFCGCIFFFIGTLPGSEEDHGLQSWLDKERILDSTFQVKYTTCLYWATITMITVGYGDITPIRVVEKQAVLIIAILICGVYAYSINIIGLIIQDITREHQEFQKKMSVLSSYMKKRGIRKDQQQQIKKYFIYLHEENIQFNEGSTIFFSELKGQLKADVLQETYLRVLNQSKLFRMNFSQDLLASLSAVMEEKRYVCDEIILDFQQECDTLYFLFRGDVQSFMEGGKLIGEQEPGSTFDEVEFFRSGKSTMKYKSNGISTVIFVRKAQLEQVLRQHPKDFERYKMMSDCLRLAGNLRGFGKRCQLCSSFQHGINQCPFVHATFNHNKILSQYNQNFFQERSNQHKRNEKRIIKMNPDFTEIGRDVRDTVVQYLIDYNPFEENPVDLLHNVQRILEYDQQQGIQSKQSNLYNPSNRGIKKLSLAQFSEDTQESPSENDKVSESLAAQATPIAKTNSRRVIESTPKDKDPDDQNHGDSNNSPHTNLHQKDGFSAQQFAKILLENSNFNEKFHLPQTLYQFNRRIEDLENIGGGVSGVGGGGWGSRTSRAKSSQIYKKNLGASFSTLVADVQQQVLKINQVQRNSNQINNMHCSCCHNSPNTAQQQQQQQQPQSFGISNNNNNNNSRNEGQLSKSTSKEPRGSLESFNYRGSIRSDCYNKDNPPNNPAGVIMNSFSRLQPRLSSNARSDKQNQQLQQQNKQQHQQPHQQQSQQHYQQQQQQYPPLQSSYNSDWEEDFERFCIFTIYFPQHNLDKVLQLLQLRRKTLQNIKKQREVTEQEKILHLFRKNLQKQNNRSRYKARAMSYRQSRSNNKLSLSHYQPTENSIKAE